MFDKIDLDGDQRVDFHEFYAAAIDHQALFTQSTIETLFNILNTNSNGEELQITDFLRIMPSNCI